MKNDRDILKQDINSLTEELTSYIDSNRIKEIVKSKRDLKEEYKKTKKEYKEKMKKAKKSISIKNLKFGAIASRALLALPFALAIPISVAANLGAPTTDYIKGNVTPNVPYNIYYYSSKTPSFEKQVYLEKENITEQGNFILKSPYEKKDDLYIRTITLADVDLSSTNFSKDEIKSYIEEGYYYNLKYINNLSYITSESTTYEYATSLNEDILNNNDGEVIFTAQIMDEAKAEAEANTNADTDTSTTTYKTVNVLKSIGVGIGMGMVCEIFTAFLIFSDGDLYVSKKDINEEYNYIFDKDNEKRKVKDLKKKYKKAK